MRLSDRKQQPDDEPIFAASRDPVYWEQFLKRYWSHVDKTEGCWEWYGVVDECGYGRVGIYGMTRKVHRIAFFIGHEYLTDGMTVDHRCRNRSCVNPSHLELVPHSENIKRGMAAKKTCKNGHPYDGHNSQGARICRQCTRQYFRDRYAAQRKVKAVK